MLFNIKFVRVVKIKIDNTTTFPFFIRKKNGYFSHIHISTYLYFKVLRIYFYI